MNASQPAPLYMASRLSGAAFHEIWYEKAHQMDLRDQKPSLHALLQNKMAGKSHQASETVFGGALTAGSS
ncbi:MAG TPA: hypothetical protein VFK82_05445, partial [Burkholderiaceae bacterium]|nr:hypothetical protein [Burkholderiaceae bacterium]